MKNANRKFKLGMHSYTLHLSGCGESWGFQNTNEVYAFERVLTLDKLMDLAVEEGIQVLHITLVDLDNDTTPAHLAAVKADAAVHGLDLELNVSLNAPCDPRVNASIEDALDIGHAIGATLVKFSLDVEHPHPISHANLCPEAMEQIAGLTLKFKKNIPTIEKYGMKIAIENHCDMFADEVIYMVKQLNHPLIGACCDTINSMMMSEGIEECVRKMAPYSYCVHFCDNRVFADPDGTHSLGCAIGDGDVDVVEVMKIFREFAPEELDTINLEIELPLSGYSLEDGRQAEIDGMRKSIRFMKDVLNIGC
ncbi:sugar phosphate isomerase/epimerase family protein [Eubacterium barkeri]|uniref:Sugar phosphate isomerase/epimerase n=1 Tax=Eubacterium barkeri TaxID=1528 RepID=A0A1H3ARL3_EUBBA|nr:sugar phosphate isomerase/epimerase [Eubacterium barkeri]SDX31489.1 Sugar phosphate isomerase/epimerase [Eubacterium barkeri]